MGHTDHAQKLFDEVLSSGRDTARAYLGMAQLNFSQAQWVQAASLAQMARASGASGFPVLYLLGRASKQAGDIETSTQALDEARGILDKTVELNPDMPEGYFLRGEVWFAMEAFNKALDDYCAAEVRTAADRIYSIFGESFSQSDVIVRQGLSLRRLNRAPEAKAAGERALAKNPENALAKTLAES
jgi:tetratricopeptide (TPR) repeat protein